MAGRRRTLDTPLKQVLVKYEEEDLAWHHRLLLVQGPTPGLWIGATPDEEVQSVDLTSFAAGKVKPLRRNAAFPDVENDGLYCFDPVGEGALAAMMDEARAFAELLGWRGGGAGASLEVWLVADVAHARFGQEVPAEATLDEDCMVVREGRALVRLEGVWTFAEKVMPDAVATWKWSKWAGPGRDPRVLAPLRDRGRETEFELMPQWRPIVKDEAPPEPLLGPRLAPELFAGLRVAGRTLVAQDAEWRARSGVPHIGMAARFHTAAIEILRALVTVDRVDPYSTIGPELCCRYIYMVEQACDRNPRQPDWEGLEPLVSLAMSTKGTIETPEFWTWLAGVQASRAQVLKQGRLLREERKSEAKKDGKGKGDGKGEGE